MYNARIEGYKINGSIYIIRPLSKTRCLFTHNDGSVLKHTHKSIVTCVILFKMFANGLMKANRNEGLKTLQVDLTLPLYYRAIEILP